MGNTQDIAGSKSNINEHVSLDNDNFSFVDPSSQTVTSSPPSKVTGQKGKKTGHKKKGRSKDEKENKSSYRNAFLAEESDNKTDMYEITPDDDLDNQTFLTPSPAVPELIVDVLKADLNSDRSDRYSTTPSVDINVPSSNRAETTLADNRDQNEIGMQSNGDDNSADDKWQADSGLHYPIIFRRSKKDPGSKQYNELVKELSTVLKKRTEATRTQSMHEEKSNATLGVELTKNSVDGKQLARSFENVNIFSDKSLLSKLEQHLASRNQNNKLISVERKESKSEGKIKDESSTDNEQRKHSDHHNASKSGTRLVVSNFGGDADMYSKPFDAKQKADISSKGFIETKSEPLYAVPNKGLGVTHNKRASAEITYDHVSSFSKEKGSIHYDRSFLPDNVTSHRFGVSADKDIDIKRQAHTLDTNSYHQEQNRKIHITNDQLPSRHHFDRHHFDRHQHHHSRDHEIAGHYSHLSRPEVNTGKSTPSLGNFITSGLNSDYSAVNLRDRNSTARDVHSYPASSSASLSPKLPSLNSEVRSMDDSWSYSQGHLTTIEIEGKGMRKQSKIMYSDPDLTREGSLTSDSGPASDVDSRYMAVTRQTDPSTAVSSSFVTARHYQKGHHHHRSLDNLLSDSSFETSENMFRMNQGNTSFAHNRSYDVSFGNESFDDEDHLHSYHFDHHSNARLFTGGSTNPHIIKVNFGNRNTRDAGNSLDRHFLTGHERSRVSRTSDYDTSSLPRSASVANVVDSSKNVTASRFNMEDSSLWPSNFDQHSRSLDRKATVLRAVSQKSSSSSSSSHASSRSKIARSQTLERNIHHQRQHGHQHSHLYIKNSPKKHHSFTSSPSENIPRSHAGAAVISPDNMDMPAFRLFVVVPPQPQPTRVPDLIVDHQQTQSQRQHQGSPFHQEIGEGALPTAHGEGLHKGEEDKPAHFIIDARNLKGTPTVQVDGPNAIAKCSIDPLPDGQYKVTYIPVEVGLFDVYVRWNDREIPGSPFHPKVVDARKVKVVGGWQHYMDGQERIHLVVGEEKKIPFDTSEAGPGQLRAEVKSPSALLPVEVDDEHKGRSVVKFTPREEGNHYIYLHWSDHPLVNSPYLGYATGGAADPTKVWLSGRGLKEAVVKEEAEFTIDGSQAGPGEPDVELTGVKAEIPVITTPLGGGKFRCTYIPIIPGAYLLNISWNGRQLRGAPYKVNVIGASYPDRVVVNGEGLKGGLLGQSLSFRIDTRKAGPGELTAYCMGPNKVAYCELRDHHDGIYSLVIRPQETGRHTLQVKYGGEHVQGSPYTFKVSAQPDASKVRVSGPGVEHGILANFQSQFIVETRGAGAGQLTVRIRGPKGAFQVEMYRESQKDRTILCRYYPSVTGLYIISVRWSGVDVPGSPFHVHILDTQQELEQVLHESSFSGSGQHHLANPSSSFHNTSINSANASHVRYAAQQNGHHHNVSRSSSYYQWN